MIEFSPVWVIRHFFLIPLRWRIRQFLLDIDFVLYSMLFLCPAFRGIFLLPLCDVCHYRVTPSFQAKRCYFPLGCGIGLCNSCALFTCSRYGTFCILEPSCFVDHIIPLFISSFYAPTWASSTFHRIRTCWTSMQGGSRTVKVIRQLFLRRA